MNLNRTQGQSHDHAQCIESALVAARQHCKARGVRLTPLREDVLTQVWQSHKPLGAYAIMDLMRESREEKVAPPTVYRALEFLLAQGLIHKINTINAFIGCPLGESKHSHSPCFFICQQCQETAEVELPGLERNLVVEAKAQGFQVNEQCVEITGLCARCQSSDGGPALDKEGGDE